MTNPLIEVLADVGVKGSIRFLENNEDFPSDASIGDFTLKDACLFAYIKIGGLETWYPFASKTNSYIHTQAEPSLQWNVFHGLGTTDVWIQVKDTNGLVINAPYEIIDADHIRISFTAARAGHAVVVAPDTINVPEVQASLIKIGADNVIIDSSGVRINGSYALTNASISQQIADAVQPKADKSYVDSQLSGKSNVGHGHIIADITGLQAALNAKATPSDISDAVATAVTDLKGGVSSDGDTLAKLRTLISNLETLVASDDINLDTVQEIVSYIKDNHDLIQSITTSKVNVSDIVNVLTSTATDKPLSAAQGKALKDLIDAVQSGAAPAVHSHAISGVTGLQTALDGKQGADATLTALAGVTTAANKLIYATGVDTFATADLTPFGRTLVGGVDAAAARSTLSLGDSATKNVGTSTGTVAAGDHSHSSAEVSDLSTVASTGAYSDLSGKPTLGTASAKDVAATGDASSTQVVMGNDSRLTDSRTPTAHTHNINIGNGASTQVSFSTNERLDIVSGSNINISYDDANNKLTVATTSAFTGNADTATKLQTGRTIGMTGDVTWTSGTFDGSGNVTGTATLANTGVTSGTYGSATQIPTLQLDSKGRVVSATNTAVFIPSGSITLTGGVSGTGTTGSSITTTLATASATTLGGVKVGTNLSIDGSGVLSASLPSSVSYSVVSITPASNGQTSFTVSGGYTVGAIRVSVSGSTLAPADYTATDGSTIVTTFGLTTNDTLLVERLSTFTITNAVQTINGKSATAGAVTLTASDVGAQATLGYTPVNKAGDALTGGLKAASVAKGSISGSVSFDLATADVFTATIAGATTISFTNAPATNQSQIVILRLTNPGSAAITWPASTKFVGGALGTLTSAGTDVLGVFYDPATSTYMVFVIGKDVK